MNWNQIALDGWLQEMLRTQTRDAHIVLADGKTEAVVCLRGNTVVLVSNDNEVLAKMQLVSK